MQALTLRQRSLVGLTLFAMFFGAGNLIFPPWLGVQAGTESLSAFIGFLITAVGFPILGVMAVAESGGLKNLGARVHPVFAFIFMFLIYLSIGPCLAIPRTASTSFEMVVRPLLAENGLLEAPLLGWTALGFSQLAYSVFFFLAAFLVALNPEKLTSRLGKFLCPTLITLICVLWLGAFVNPIGEAGAPAAAYAGAALAHGFIDGYQTMDTLAALNFGLIIAMNIRAMGIKSEGAVVKETVFAGYIAAAVFFVVYGALTQIGAEAGGAFTGMENGAQTLTAVADKLFGTAGQVLLGLVFFIACFNTCVGLIACCSDYFSGLFPKLGYRGWAVVFAAVSMVISNAGLTLILKFSIPVLVAIYPLAIVLIALGLINLAWKNLHLHRWVYPLSMLFTGVVSVTAGLEAFGLNVPFLSNLCADLPWSNIDLGWISPAIGGAAAGLFLSWKIPHACDPRT